MSTSTMGNPIGNPPTEKLTRANHLLWKALVLPALRGARVLNIVDGKEPAPAETIEVEKDMVKVAAPNPAYDAWLTKDQHALSYLLGTLSPEILAQAVGMEHSAEVWSLVNDLFASRSKANVTHLRGALSSTKKLNMTADQYVAKMKGFATELVAAGRTIEDDELVDLILNGLDEDYNGLVASVNAMTNCSVSDLHALLNAFDMRQIMLHGGDAQKKFESSANSATRGRDRRDDYNKRNYHGHGRPRGRGEERGRDGGGGRRPPQRGRGRGRGRGGPPPRPRDVVCQICKKEGHGAHSCWWRYSGNDDSYDSYDNNDSYDREANAAYCVDPNWYPDTGTTNHVAGNLEKLIIRDTYHGKDKIHTANGEGSSHEENPS